MKPVWPLILELIGRDGRVALVSVMRVEGSAPREAGARMVVRADGSFHGTIGGGALEFEVLAQARRALAAPAAGTRGTRLLGPELGQCCGGRVEILIETFAPADLDWIEPLASVELGRVIATVGRRDEAGRYVRRLSKLPTAAPVTWRDDGALVETFGEALLPVMLFGAGHVGQALALALAPLPATLRWTDSRADAFPPHVPANATTVRSDDPPAELTAAPAGAAVVVVTHSHPLDLAIVDAALRAERFAYVGLIGSAAKRARFESRLRAAGVPAEAIAALVCPVGVAGIRDKSPAVIAAALAAELMLVRETGSAFARSPAVVPAEAGPDTAHVR